MLDRHETDEHELGKENLAHSVTPLHSSNRRFHLNSNGVIMYDSWNWVWAEKKRGPWVSVICPAVQATRENPRGAKGQTAWQMESERETTLPVFLSQDLSLHKRTSETVKWQGDKFRDRQGKLFSQAFLKESEAWDISPFPGPAQFTVSSSCQMYAGLGANRPAIWQLWLRLCLTSENKQHNMTDLHIGGFGGRDEAGPK